MKRAVGLSPIGPIGTYLKKLSTYALNKPKHFITGAKSFLNYTMTTTAHVELIVRKLLWNQEYQALDLNCKEKYVGKIVILTHTHKL